MKHTTTIATGWYHSSLRITALLFAAVLIFESGIINPATQEIAATAGQQMAGVVGMSASIAPNELNRITAQLTAKEQELAAREASLNEREIAVEVGGAVASNRTSTFVLSTILFILLLLIILNYILDYLRSKEREYILQGTSI